MVTSCKGGVGKSTITANLSMALALLGKKTLVIDCDFGMRCLDLIMGYENDIIYDISDIAKRKIPFSKAIITDWRCNNLFFCAAPYSYNNDIEIEDFRDIMSEIIDKMYLDYIFIDTPGGIGAPLVLASCVATLALVIASHQPTSLRAAEKTSAILHDLNVNNQRLIINNFDGDSVKNGTRMGIIEIIDKTYVKLIGVIPDDTTLMKAQENSILINEMKPSNVTTAFYNIAERLNGQNVPLLSGFKRINRLKYLK